MDRYTERKDSEIQEAIDRNKGHDFTDERIILDLAGLGQFGHTGGIIWGLLEDWTNRQYSDTLPDIKADCPSDSDIAELKKEAEAAYQVMRTHLHAAHKTQEVNKAIYEANQVWKEVESRVDEAKGDQADSITKLKEECKFDLESELQMFLECVEEGNSFSFYSRENLALASLLLTMMDSDRRSYKGELIQDYIDKHGGVCYDDFVRYLRKE